MKFTLCFLPSLVTNGCASKLTGWFPENDLPTSYTSQAYKLLVIGISLPVCSSSSSTENYAKSWHKIYMHRVRVCVCQVQFHVKFYLTRKYSFCYECRERAEIKFILFLLNDSLTSVTFEFKVVEMNTERQICSRRIYFGSDNGIICFVLRKKNSFQTFSTPFFHHHDYAVCPESLTNENRRQF